MDRCERRSFFNRGIESRIPKRSWSSAARNSISPIAGLNTAFLQHILLMIEPAAPRMGRGGVRVRCDYFAKTFFSLAKRGRPLTFSSFVSPWISGMAYLMKSSVTLLPSGVDPLALGTSSRSWQRRRGQTAWPCRCSRSCGRTRSRPSCRSDRRPSARQQSCRT